VIKPAINSISQRAIIPVSSFLDSAGPIARSAEDLALIFEII
jgi:Asp-tRNA(Asn)/Glu-tRNA(Gln) amidotransferase A subunit family amidase